MIELWKPVPGYVGYYEASSCGRIRSVPRVVKAYSPRGCREYTACRDGRVMSLHLTKRTGYLTVCLSRDGLCKTKRVNAVVCATFNGSCAPGLICCHGDGNKLNNAPSNLRWDTPMANMADRLSHGTDCRGENVGTSKLTSEQASQILAGMRLRDARARFGIGPSQFYRIKHGKSWAHIGAEHGVRFSAPEYEDATA